ncbi:MAG: MoxR family ATPase [Proteobacteria bacterium]|nr:MoxR family ATPase [Pseudomonadota bacterium]
MHDTIAQIQQLHNIIGREEELELSLIAAGAGKHILLSGTVGVGKTTIAMAVASHLGRNCLRIDGDERYTEQKLAGWFDPPLVMAKGYTKEAFIQGPLTLTMEEGSILLLNELNRMPEGTQNVLLSAMDEKKIYIPKYGKVEGKEGFLIIATQNPDEYIGTSQLSEALKDRFICITLFNQNEDEEIEIVKLRSMCPDEQIITLSVIFTRLTRDEQAIRRGSSIRGAIDLADIFYSANKSFNDNPEAWVKCAKLAFSTKIELHDFSHDNFLELLKKLALKSLEKYKQRLTSPKRDVSANTTATPSDFDGGQKKNY